MQEPAASSKVSGASIFNDAKVRGAVYQAALVLFLCYLVWSLVSNTIANIQARNIPFGFDFIWTTAGFGIIQSLIDYSEISTYGRALAVGVVNTLFVAAIGIFLATILGFILGIARLSSNFVIASLARVYVEIIRNIPLLLQILFWYNAVLQAVPDGRGKLSLFGLFHLNITGLYMPGLAFADGAYVIGIAFLAAIVLCFVLSHWAKKRQMATGQQFPVFLTSIALLVGLPAIAQFLSGFPVGVEFPVFSETGPILQRGFQRGVGLVLLPEFLALLLALVIYTAAFIGEIVRAGIMAVSKGQTEASHALGLRQGPTLRLVIIPQALRVIIPPLTSQYLNLTKNSSLAVAIAYPDLVAVGGTVLNQTGQAIEIVALWMAVYLSLSLLTSAFMNWYNRRMALVER